MWQFFFLYLEMRLLNAGFNITANKRDEKIYLAKQDSLVQRRI